MFNYGRINNSISKPNHINTLITIIITKSYIKQKKEDNLQVPSLWNALKT